MPLYNRLLLLATGLIAAYQISLGIEGAVPIALVSYTIGFGALLISALLMLLLSLEVLKSSWLVVLAALIPISISLGLISEYHPQDQRLAGFLAAGGLLVIAGSRALPSKNISGLLVGLIHGFAALTIILIPLVLVVQDHTPVSFLLVSLGGIIMSAGGMLLFFLKAGKPLVDYEFILKVLPVLLFLTTAAFTAGFTLL